MGTPRCLIETGPDSAPDFHVHVETGRARGALNSVLVVPRAPAQGLADALHDLHDPHGATDLDTRLGQLAGRAPEGTAFIVALEDQVWVFPSEAVGICRRRGDQVEKLTEPQVLRLVAGDEFVLRDEANDADLACVRGTDGTPARVPIVEPEGPSESTAPVHSHRPARFRAPAPGRRAGITVAGLLVVAMIVFGYRAYSGRTTRVDAHVGPSLEQRVVELFAHGGAESRSTNPTDPAGDDAAVPNESTSNPADEADDSEFAQVAVPVEPTRSTPPMDWRFQTAGAITSSPLLSEGHLYFGCRDKNLYALDASTGEPIWTLPTDSGIGSSPRASGDLLFVGTYGGKVLAVNRSDGTVAWEGITGGRIVSSPCIVGDRVIVGSYDGSVHAFDRTDGTPVWTVSTGSGVRASPEPIGEDAIGIGSGNGRFLVLATADGAIRWERGFPSAVHAQASWDAERGCVYVGAQDGTTNCLAADTGERRWSRRLDSEINAQPRLAGSVLLVGTGRGKLHAMDPATGQDRWTVQAARGFDACPVVLGDTVLAPSFDGTLHRLALEDGRVLEQREIGSEVFSSPAAGEGLLYVGTMGGTLHALALP